MSEPARPRARLPATHQLLSNTEETGLEDEPARALFHSHTLGEVSRFVHVVAAQDRRMVRQKL